MKIFSKALLAALFIICPHNFATKILVKNTAQNPVKVTFKSKGVAWTTKVNKGNPIKSGEQKIGNDGLGIKLSKITIDGKSYNINSKGRYWYLKITPGDSKNKFNYELYKSDTKKKIGKLAKQSTASEQQKTASQQEIAALFATMAPEDQKETISQLLNKTNLTAAQIKELIEKDTLAGKEITTTQTQTVQKPTEKPISKPTSSVTTTPSQPTQAPSTIVEPAKTVTQPTKPVTQPTKTEPTKTPTTTTPPQPTEPSVQSTKVETEEEEILEEEPEEDEEAESNNVSDESEEVDEE